MKPLKSKLPLCLSVLACAALAQPTPATASEPTLLVGGALLNGDFNANPGATVTFANTTHWYNTIGDQSVVATRSDEAYDGTQNGVLSSGRGFGVDTGHTIGERDRFSFSYVWKDSYDWATAGEVSVSLFVTSDNTITGTRTDLLVDASGPGQVNGAYEAVSRDVAYVAEAAHAGKTLFAAIETSASGFARIDNFSLTVNPANPLVDPETPAGVLPYSGQSGWELVFSDEFNGTTLDTSKWGVDISTRTRAPRWDRGIHEWYYAEENVSLDGSGSLVLDVTKVDSNTMHTGSISSDGIYEPKYGYLEARIQIGDSTKDTHTAFWLQGANMGNVDGTGNDGAEVDIFESAWVDDYTKSVVHIDGYGADKQASTKQYDTPGLHSGYHHFGLEWTPNSMKIYFNGVHKVTYTGIWVPQVPEWLWLSTGASFGDIGTFAEEDTGWLTSAKVDYVRVWQYDGNREPYFLSDPLGKAPATVGSAYSESVAGDALDDDEGDSITYSKVSGPANDWLTVGPDGSLSGTPTIENEGSNSWTLQASDGAGGSTTTTLEIVVNPVAGPMALVGGSLLNGDFNANPGDSVSFAETDHWYNTKGQQSQVATLANNSYDGSQNGSMTSGRGFGIDTGYRIGEGDRFDFSYAWKDDWKWVDASDQVTVSLFVTADNTITGTRTDLLVDASGLRQVNDAWETVSREEAYTAVAADAGKTLFAAIETTSGGFARIDNFSLTVNRTATFAEWIAGYGLDPDQQGLNDDPDGDGIANGLELWFGTHPGETTSAIAELAWQGLNFSFSHPMSENPPSDLVGAYEWSPNLVDWYAGDGVDGPAGGATVLFEATTDGQSAQVNATASSAMERFFARIAVGSE